MSENFRWLKTFTNCVSQFHLVNKHCLGTAAFAAILFIDQTIEMRLAWRMRSRFSALLPIRCSVSRRVHFQTFPSIDLTTNGWSFYSYTTDLVNNAEECERRPGKSACWGKILFYDVCKWQSSFSLQSKIVFWLTLIRARTDCTVR